MNETVQNLVDAIKSGDAIATETAFANAMAERLSAKIDTMRMDISQSMFNQPAPAQVSEEAADLAEIVANYTEEFAADELSLNEEELAELTEKYEGFKQLSGELAAKGAKNPGGLAAWIGRRKYGNKKFQSAAANDKKLG